MFIESAGPAANDSSPPRRSFNKLKGRQGRPVPASRDRGISALEKKYREVLGTKKQLQEAEYDWDGREGFEAAKKYLDERLRYLNETLIHIRKSADLIDPTWSRTRERCMAPLVKRSSPLLPKGVFKPAFIHVLRAANGIALEVSEIADRIARKLDLPTHRRDQRQKLYSMTYNALRSAYDRGQVECLDCMPARWLLAGSSSHSDAI